MTATVLLADDHAIVRDGLKRVLEETGQIQVVAQASDGLQAVALAEQLRPQVILMDISMPVLGGLEATRQIKSHNPSTAVVFLTMHESEQYFLEALRCGAEGYVPKSASAEEVVDAVLGAVRGQVYLHPSVARFLLHSFLVNSEQSTAADPYQGLTGRERQVLTLIANGLNNHEIADALVLSPHTVHRHRTNVMQKLGLHDRMDVLRYCIQRGLVDAQA